MPLTFRSQPRISAAQFIRVLERYKSPCAPIGQECYDIIVNSSLDPAVSLAFFGHESTFGTRGITVETRNWGNVRAPFKPERASGHHPKNFAIYPNWQIGLVDWCDRINVRYIQERGLDTVEKAVPIYAPSFDGNVPQVYIDHVNKLVSDWMAEDQTPQAPKDQPDTSAALRDALIAATFTNAGATFRADSPLHQFYINEARAGRSVGNPQGEMKRIQLNGQDYVIQVFALDTLYAPVQNPSEVHRLSELIMARP